MNVLYVCPIHNLCVNNDVNTLAVRLSAARRKKIDRLQVPADQARSLAAGLALEAALRPFGLHEKDACFTENANGKPALFNHVPFYFSLSHSGEYAVCAVSDTPCGVDIEKIQKSDRKIALRFFHDHETQALSQVPEPAYSLQFTRLWTLKESYLKYTGTGLSCPLNSFYMKLTEPAAFDLHHNRLSCRFFEPVVSDAYRLSLCTDNIVDEPNMMMIDPLTLFSTS